MREMWGNMASQVARCSCISVSLASRPGRAGRSTNLAFFRHASTSDGNEEETCGCVAVAEASQFSGGCWISVMLKV